MKPSQIGKLLLLVLLLFAEDSFAKKKTNRSDQNVDTNEYAVHQHNYEEQKMSNPAPATGDVIQAQESHNVEYRQLQAPPFGKMPRDKRGTKKFTKHYIHVVQPSTHKKRRITLVQKKPGYQSPQHYENEKVIRTYEETHEHIRDNGGDGSHSSGEEHQSSQPFDGHADPLVEESQHSHHMEEEANHEPHEEHEHEHSEKHEKREKIRIKHHHHHHHHNHVKEIIKKVPEPYPVEKIVHIPVEKIVEKVVHVPKPYPVEKIVEKKIPYPVEKIVHVPVEKVVEKVIHVPKPYPVEKIVEKVVHVPVEKVVEKIVHVPKPYPVEKIVNKIIHVPRPYPVIKPVPYPVEVKVPVHIEKKVNVPVPVKVEVEKKIPVYIHSREPYKYERPEPLRDTEHDDEKPEDNFEDHEEQQQHFHHSNSYENQHHDLSSFPTTHNPNYSKNQQQLQQQQNQQNKRPPSQGGGSPANPQAIRAELLRQQIENFNNYRSQSNEQSASESKNIAVPMVSAPFKIQSGDAAAPVSRSNEPAGGDLQPQQTTHKLQLFTLPLRFYQVHPMGFSLPGRS